MSAFRGVGLVLFVAAHGALLGNRSGAGDESTRSDYAAMSGEIAWFQAAEIIGISCR